MKIVHGDLIQLAKRGDFDVIVHGCNCFHSFGAGIARQIRHAFPAAYRADLATERGAYEKLGDISVAQCGNVTVVNAYTQFEFGGGKRRANYSAIDDAFSNIKQRFPGKRIGYPMIGAGLAGGDWDVIAPIIDRELDGEDHTLVMYQKFQGRQE